MKNKENKTNVEVKTNKSAASSVFKNESNNDMAQDAQPNLNGPFTLMRHFAEDMEAIFSDFGLDRKFLRLSVFEDDPFFKRDELFVNWSPEVEMLERDGELVVRADLPGMDKDDINVEIKDNRLTITGERKKESEEEKKGVYRSERSYGSFCRSFALPEAIDTDKAQAKFKNGVLEVTLAAPRLAESSNRLEISEENSDSQSASSGG